MNRDARIRCKALDLLNRGTLSRSECSLELIRWLKPLLDAKVLSQERSGAGQVLRVQRRDDLERYIRRQFPGTSIPAGLDSKRLRGIAEFRNTKSLGNDTAERVSLRGWNSGQLLKNGTVVELAEATQLHGLFAFLLRTPGDYELRGSIAVVENPTVFNVFEHRWGRHALAIYGGGRISDSLLNWFESQTAPEFSLTHYPDYDPVGLSDYIRIKKRLGARVSLHVPADLESWFSTHSNPTLLDGEASRRMLAKLRESELAEVRQITTWMDRYAGGLEQEALLLEE